MDKPFFSIVIPTLNEEQYLPKLLETLVIQRFGSYQIFVVDGGSTDKTLDKVKSFKEKLPLDVLYSNKKNVGYQRNMGASYAKGKYLIFLDADCFLPSGFLSRLQKLLEQKNNPPLATALYLPDSDKPYDEFFVFLLNLGIEVAKLIEHPQALGVNLIIKRTIFNKIGGFKEKIKMAEDQELVQRACKKGYDISIFKEPRVHLSLRRIRAEGAFTMAMRYTYAYFYCTFKGPITSDLFPYQMGGHVYEEHAKNTKGALKIPKSSFDEIYHLARDNKFIENMRERFKHI